MGIFSKPKQQNTTPEPTPAPATPPTGTVSLKKGGSVSLSKKGGSDAITAENGWTAACKDYDLKALVRYRNGKLVYVGAANIDEVLHTPDGAIRHSGDARNPGELETLTIKWHPDIASVALSSYSALENGAGSFSRYGVFVRIIGDKTVTLNAVDSQASDRQYTLCFGEIIFNPDGTFTVINHEMYSRPNSERRVGYRGDQVVMDIGPEGKNK